MTYQPFPIERFGGLDQVSDPEQVGPERAVDMLNVDLLQGDQVRTRDGMARMSSVADLGNSALRANDIAKYGTGLIAISYDVGAAEIRLDRRSAGAIISSIGGWAASNYYSHAKLGTPTTTLLFVATTATLRKYDGAALAASVGAPRYVAVTPSSNRLVQGYFGAAADSPTGANGSVHTVFFSDAGAPETFSANNFVHLRPGDDEQINAIGTWADMTFVFKDSCFFVFYGESTGADGNPIFNYRRVDLDGAFQTCTTRGSAVTAGKDGLYYRTSRGVFRTTGGAGALVSRAVDIGLAGSLGMSFLGDRLLVNTTSDTYVWDQETDQWMRWQLATDPSKFAGSSFIAEQGGVRNFYTLDEDQLTDNGTAISSYYQSGVYPIGTPGADTFTRWTRVWGSGSPTVSVFTDHGTTDSRAAAVTLGTSPAIADGYHQQSYKGKMFSHKLSATSGVWSANRLQHDLAWVRP